MPLTLHFSALEPVDLVVRTGMQIRCDYRSLKAFWLHGYAGQTNCTPANYQAVVKNTINAITAMKLNVILDLMWTDAGGQDTGSGAGYELPDNDSVTFWSQAAKVYAGYSNVLFELYNEPHPSSHSSCWAAGCAITKTILETGAK